MLKRIMNGMLNGMLAVLLISTLLSAQNESEATTDLRQSIQLTSEQEVQTVSPGKAGLLSLILPGAGELYLGQRNFFTVFLSTEIVAWAALIGNRLYYNHLVREYKTYARQHAGFDPTVPRDDRYWVDIGKYDDIYSFNDQRERERYFADLYEVTPENYWRWDQHENRIKYDGKRIHANDVDNQRVYFQLAIVLNHLVSGINALRLARRHNKQLEEQKVGFRFDAYRESKYSNYIGFNLNVRF
ncbi:hypothetical protein ACX8XN_05560 [Calditrichota bacterium GD2]